MTPWDVIERIAGTDDITSIAEASGLTYESVRRYKHGISYPSKASCIKLSAVYFCDWLRLYNEITTIRHST